jgi:hypothetical protein
VVLQFLDNSVRRESNAPNVLSCASGNKLLNKAVARNWARLYIAYYCRYEGELNC